jgi:cytochrome c-type biogenesis protein
VIDVGVLVAFAAGALSISSPCVLPLIPLYLAHLTGVGVAGTTSSRRLLMSHAAAFVAGFALIFVLLGVSLGALGGVFLIYRPWLIRFGGVFMVVMGLQLAGLIRIPGLGREHRIAIASGRQGRLGSSFLVGMGFASGWMPCVGPVLGAILTMAVGAADPVRSGELLAAYAAGLGVPFLAAAFALGRFDRRLQRWTAKLNVGGSAVLIAVGIMMFLGIYQQAFARIVGLAPWTPWEPSV